MKKQAEKILNKAKMLGAEGAEVFITKKKELTARVINGQIDAIETAMPVGLGVRLIKDNRQGFSYTTDIKDFDVVERAIKAASYVESDDFFCIPEVEGKVSSEELGLYDSRVAELTVNDCLERAFALEKNIYKRDSRIVKTERAGFFIVQSEDFVFNSNSIDAYQQRTLFGATGEVIAEENGQSEAGAGFRMYRNYQDYQEDVIAQEAAEDATTLLGAKSVVSGKYQIILPGTVSRQFLGIFAQAFMADNYQKNKSMFTGEKGARILQDRISIFDDSLLFRGLGSSLFDGEGLPGQTTSLVEKGVFENLLYDSYTAKKDKVVSTANAQRGFSSLPSVGVNNFYMTFDNPVADVYKDSSALVITNVMGLHTANPITGDFSFGASGYLLKDGQKQHGIRNMAVAGNLKDFFNKIIEAEKDSIFVGHVGCPALKLSDINIAGE